MRRTKIRVTDGLTRYAFVCRNIDQSFATSVPANSLFEFNCKKSVTRLRGKHHR